MSEQTIQNNLYSNPVVFGKYTCYSLGATTIKDLIKTKEIKNKKLNSINDKKKPDVLIINNNKEIVVYIEMKLPEEFSNETKKEKAIYQEIDVAKGLGAKIYVISDGNEFIWINPLTGNTIFDENNKEINEKINPKDRTEEQNKELEKIIDIICKSITNTNDNVLPKEYIDPTELAKKTARILEKMTLSSAKNSLYTFVEIFIFKFLSDLDILKGDCCFNYVYGLYKSNGSKIAFERYLTNVRKSLKELFPTADDETTIINGLIFHTKIDDRGNPIILENSANCFGKLLDCFYDYEKENNKFDNINRDFKSKLFEVFMKNSAQKDGMGQFFTPLKVVKEMVEMVDVKEGMKICDPACGVAKFLLEASLKIDRPFYFENNSFRQKISLFGFEKRMEDQNDDLTAILAKANALIYYSDLFKDNCDDSIKIKMLSEKFLNKIVHSKHTTLGTLDELVENEYDLILANPPYYKSAIYTEESKNIFIKNSQTKERAYTKNGNGVEALFLEWIVKSLKNGGIANVVLPDGIFDNIGNNELKTYILNTCNILSIISLPNKTFFNTPKKTYILTLQKKYNNEIQKEKVFCYLCSSIGETLNSYRFDDEMNNDLKKCVILYNIYRTKKADTNIQEYILKDKRAKLVDIQIFFDTTKWNIDNLWNKAEKESFGLIEKTNSISLDDLETLIEDLNDDTKNYTKLLNSQKNNTNKKIKYIEKSLKELFNAKNGRSELTKSYCNQNKGEYEVFAGNVLEHFGYIDTFDYDLKNNESYISFTTDGVNSGTVSFLSGKFSIGSHRTVLIPKEEYKDKLCNEYIKYYLTDILKSNYRDGDVPSVKWNKIKDETIKLPLDNYYNIDLNEQERMAKRFVMIENDKKAILDKIKDILSYSIELE